MHLFINKIIAAPGHVVVFEDMILTVIWWIYFMHSLIGNCHEIKSFQSECLIYWTQSPWKQDAGNASVTSKHLYLMKTPGPQLTLEWHHNERDGVSNHWRLGCLLNSLFRHRSKKTSKLHITGLCEGNSPVTSEFPAQRASNAENVSIWIRHHAK